MLIETTSPKFTAMEITNLRIEFPRGEKVPLRLHDSMEFYKQKGLTTGGSPPSAPQPAYKPGLLVTSDEDDIVFEDSDIEKPQLSDSRFYYASASESDSEDERKTSLDSDASDEECEVNLNYATDYASDSDEIVFADSDEDQPKKSFVATPFWFGHEDKDQIKCINDSYYHSLKLHEEKKRCIRQPEPFVGRITRRKVDNTNAFTTFDLVEICRRSLLPPGSVMPITRTVHMLTTWSFDDGLPLEVIPLTNPDLIEQWEGCIMRDVKPSTLLCLPYYGSNGYQYLVAQESLEVTHSPDSLNMIEKRCWYDEYIPKELRSPQGEEGFSGA